MLNGIVRVPPPVNDPIRAYRPGSAERASIKKRLQEMASEQIEIPLIIGGKEVRTGKLGKAICPHEHGHVLATYHQAGPAEIDAAVAAAGKAWKEWSETPWEARVAVFLKAAELLVGPWRDTLNASTMLGQSK
ncbi:MAG: aldehyde dehydrogenase family protein, partial [Acidobacteria bacterium]|nr:aldehyde dehydrogenase family protein [Acidobacteriota bacterium]